MHPNKKHLIKLSPEPLAKLQLTITTARGMHAHHSYCHAQNSNSNHQTRLNYIYIYVYFNKQIAIVAINQCALANLKVNCSCNNRICEHRDNAPAHSTNSRKQIRHATQREYSTNKSTNTTNLPIAEHPCCCGEYSCSEYSSCKATQL